MNLISIEIIHIHFNIPQNTSIQLNDVNDAIKSLAKIKLGYFKSKTISSKLSQKSY